MTQQPDTERHDVIITPNPEPQQEPSDPHLPPLDDEDDARWLDPIDPRRRNIERKRGQPFND